MCDKQISSTSDDKYGNMHEVQIAEVQIAEVQIAELPNSLRVLARMYYTEFYDEKFRQGSDPGTSRMLSANLTSGLMGHL